MPLARVAHEAELSIFLTPATVSAEKQLCGLSRRTEKSQRSSSGCNRQKGDSLTSHNPSFAANARSNRAGGRKRGGKGLEIHTQRVKMTPKSGTVTHRVRKRGERGVQLHAYQLHGR